MLLTNRDPRYPYIETFRRPSVAVSGYGIAEVELLKWERAMHRYQHHVSFWSTSDLRSDGQPVSDAGQVVWRAWSAVLAMIGQQASKPCLRTARPNGYPKLIVAALWPRLGPHHQRHVMLGRLHAIVAGLGAKSNLPSRDSLNAICRHCSCCAVRHHIGRCQ
jgi:hypothetical protein